MIQRFFKPTIFIIITLALLAFGYMPGEATESNSYEDVLVFEEDFSSDKGWIDESNGHIYRDTVNERLVYNVIRNETRRWLMPIKISPDSFELSFRFNVTGGGGNKHFYVGLVEELGFPITTGAGIQSSGAFLGLFSLGGYGTRVALLESYQSGDFSLPLNGDNGIPYGGYNVWHRVSLSVDSGNWTVTLWDDLGTQLGQESGTFTDSHSVYNYIFIGLDQMGNGWEWSTGYIDDISVYH